MIGRGFRVRFKAAMVAGLFVVGCHVVPPLPRLGQVPDFSLIDHEGHPIRRADLSGSVWIADFIFTRCAGQCPLMSAEMAQFHHALREPRLVSFSVDPSYDTPPVLAQYAAHYGAHAPHWRFVTGSADAITSLAQQGFHLGIGVDGTAEEPITHSVRFVLVDQQGWIRGTYEATDARAMQQLQSDARRLAAEE